MPLTAYQDLAEFGLPLITPDDSTFAALATEILACPQPLGPNPAADLGAAAVLKNESGKSIVALAYIWRHTTVDGATHTHRNLNLGSSVQMNVLKGRTPVVRDRASFILSGSKRLITKDGLFGDNLDVLAGELAPFGGGWMGAGRNRFVKREGKSNEDIARIELQLDVAFFDDGLCVGPDEFGLFEAVANDLERERQTAAEIVEELRNGASVCRVFEILRPLARHQIGSESGGRGVVNHHTSLLTMFTNMAIRHLMNAGDTDLLAWFEEAARPFGIQLHRP